MTAHGWAESHQYEDFGTDFMIYGPRTDEELEFVVSIVEETLSFARGT